MSRAEKFVVQQTADQLGITEDEIKPQTIVPNIHLMVLSAVGQFVVVVVLSNNFKFYTVAEAICEFEKQI